MRGPRHPRHFTDDFKRQIVDLYNAGKPKREIKRRTRGVGTFPDSNSALMLVTARLKYTVEHKWGSVEKVGVAPEPKQVGPASKNLEYG